MPAPSHRMRFTSFYTSWNLMKQRCTNPKIRSYVDYGGRGITFCERWHKFENFMEDMLPTYKEGLTLSRVDNDGHYCKENCEWATVKEQNNNTRRNRYLTYKGVTKTLSQWAEFIGVKRSTLSMRYYVYKWELADCLNNI